MGQKIAPRVGDFYPVSRCPNGRVFAFQQRGTKFDNGTSSNRRRLHVYVATMPEPSAWLYE